MSVITPHVVRYCAEECAWQQSGEISVAAMVDAWRYAHRHRHKPIMLRDVLVLGRLVEPVRNLGGLRRTVVLANWNATVIPALVPDALDALLKVQPEIGEATEAEATEWFRQFEEAHPFSDGNGRVGSLLYQWLRGSLHEPVHVPNLWNDPRREPLHA